MKLNAVNSAPIMGQSHVETTQATSIWDRGLIARSRTAAIVYLLGTQS